MSERGRGGGWADFAAVVFAIAGFANAIQGLTGLFKREYFAESGLVYENLGFWAVVWLIFGLCQIGVASLLIGRQPAARIIGIVLAAGSAVVAFMSIGAYPFWEFAVLGMDLLIIYGLTAHPEAFGGEAPAGADWAPPDIERTTPPRLG